MNCPVCNILLPPLQEFCVNCMSNWVHGQEDCPATVRDTALQVIARCTLGFRHHDRKHRMMGFRFFDDGPEITLIWFYPENARFKKRADEFMELRGDG